MAETLWFVALGCNFFFASSLPSDSFIVLREGQYKIEPATAGSKEKVSIRSDLFTPISLVTAGIVNVVLILAMGAAAARRSGNE